MAQQDKEKPSSRRQGDKRGRIPNWWPDSESLALLDLYRERRRSSESPPKETALKTEMDYLRGMVYASVQLGGPNTLRMLRDDGEVIIKIMRSWPRTHRTIKGMLTAMLRLIEFTADNPEEATNLRVRIQAGLYPRPLGRRAFNHIPRMVGGTTQVEIRRPALQVSDLRNFVAAAGAACENRTLVTRDRAICAIYCFSGVSPGELHTLTWEGLEWLEEGKNEPWCALLHGIRRRGRELSIPIHKEARSYLEDLAEGIRRRKNHLFCSGRVRNASLGDAMAKAVIRKAGKNSGIASQDNVTIKRAYASYLEASGIGDYEIRDALGLKMMSTVDRLLGSHHRRKAQRVLLEHHVIEPPRDCIPSDTLPIEHPLTLEFHTN